MSITALAYHQGHYLGNKLSQHIINRSEESFAEAAAKRSAITSTGELACYAEYMRRSFEQALGGIPYDSALPLHAEVTGVIHEKYFDIEKIVYQSRPSVYVTANLYIPHERKEPNAAVLFCMGHADSGKQYSQYQTVARSIASAGLIVLVPDPFGQGERHSYVEAAAQGEMVLGCTGDHEYAGKQIMMNGDAPARYFIADAKRAIDYLISRPEVDPERIGVTGSSGGGTMTCNMMVCDPRVKAAAPGTFLSSRQTILHSGKAQDAEQIWMGAENFTFDHEDVLACFAPKPCLVLCDDADFFPMEGSVETMNRAKRLYALHGAEDKLSMTVDHSIHAYTRKLAADAAAFLSRELLGEAREVITEVIEPIDAKSLLCTKTGQVRTSYPDARFLFDENYEKLLKKCEEAVTKEAAAFLHEKVYAFRKPVPLQLREFPAKMSSGVVSNSYFWFTQNNMPNYGVMFRKLEDVGKDIPVKVCLFDRGTKDIHTHRALIQRILRSGSAAFVLDVTGTGLCEPDAYWGDDNHVQFGTIDILTKHLFFLGDSLAAIRLYDLECLPGVLEAIPHITGFSLYAAGNSGILAKLYGVMHEDVIVEVENCQSISDVVLHRYYEEYDLAGYMLLGIAPYAVKLGL